MTDLIVTTTTDKTAHHRNKTEALTPFVAPVEATRRDTGALFFEQCCACATRAVQPIPNAKLYLILRIVFSSIIDTKSGSLG